MARLVLFQPHRQTDPPSDPLDKLIVVLVLMIIWRLLGA
jgi:hypothetical protein